ASPLTTGSTTDARADAPGREGTVARLRSASRAEVTRTTAALETRVTKRTPTGDATRRTSHAPRSPTPVRSAVPTAQPTRPPAVVAWRSAAPRDSAVDACARSPAALTRSTVSPVNGRTPRVTGGRTNADAPHPPRSNGKRK